MTIGLHNWLYTPCDTNELVPLDKEVFYLPIGVVKKKIERMENEFGVTVMETGFNHLYFTNGQKEAIASGSICIEIYQDGILINKLIGTATFPLSYYGPNTHYAATLESLCIVNAFGGKYPQFGSALNKLDVVSPAAKQIIPSAVNDIDKVNEKLFNNLKKKLSKYSNREDAQAYLETTDYRMNLEAKAIAESLPLKQ